MTPRSSVLQMKCASLCWVRRPPFVTAQVTAPTRTASGVVSIKRGWSPDSVCAVRRILRMRKNWDIAVNQLRTTQMFVLLLAIGVRLIYRRSFSWHLSTLDSLMSCFWLQTTHCSFLNMPLRHIFFRGMDHANVDVHGTHAHELWNADGAKRTVPLHHVPQSAPISTIPAHR